MTETRDAKYLSILLEPLRVCASYRPKMGQGAQAGLSLEDFRCLYHGDPFYAWFGLDHPLMYAAHKAAGGITSVYRQIGIGSEALVRAVFRDELKLSEDQAKWAYTVVGANNKRRQLSLDARIPLAAIESETKRVRVQEWMTNTCKDLGVSRRIASRLQGVVFEVRQGYKSKDSKRQNADLANAATAYTKAYLPCVLVMSNQIDADIVHRYRSEKWATLTGTLGDTSALRSTYEFMRDVVGYPLADFFTRNSRTLQAEVAKVLEVLLKAE